MEGPALVFTGFLLLGALFAVFMTWLPTRLAPREPNPVKSRSYECGEVPVGQPWIRFRIAYYLFALIFVVFDIETVFLYPWAVIFRKLGVFGLVEMALFIGILTLGLAYAWRKGVLKWV